MELAYPSTVEQFRARIRAFIAEHLPADWRGLGALSRSQREDFVARWRVTLADSGLLAVSWPREFGGAGLSVLEQAVLAEELTRAGVPAGAPNDMFGIDMLGNTIIALGTAEQKRTLLPRIISGVDVWCQGFSEPETGSDLAAVRTRADLDGDSWVVNGSKIWTSYGHLANWIFVLARTDRTVVKHRGISFLLVPMVQPGVEVRPIRDMAGEPFFNQVFFTDARMPKSHVVGEVNDGWKVATTLLGFERGVGAVAMALRFRADLDRLVRLAREQGRARDPRVRALLGQLYGRVEILRLRGYRTLTALSQGRELGAEAAITKVLWSEYFRDMSEVALEMLGPAALTVLGQGTNGATYTADIGAPNTSHAWIDTALTARAATIYAGTSEVQRTIIGERLLGLPREPRAASRGNDIDGRVS